MPYDPWTSMTPRPAPQAPDPASLPLTDEPVAGWKPAMVKGVRYETRNTPDNVVSRAVEIDVPGTGKPKVAETLYGRYTTVAPGMITQAKSLAKGGDIAQAKEIIQQVDAFVDGDEDRLMAHMNYQGRERVAAGFAKTAAGSVTRYWHQDPELRDWLNPATNPMVAKHVLATAGVPAGSALYRDTEAAYAGDRDAVANVSALERAAGGAFGAGGRAGAGRAQAPGGQPQDRVDDPEFRAKVYGNADTALPGLFGEEAYKGMTRDQRMKASWAYTPLAEDHPQAHGIISKVMDGARDAAPQAQAALFGQVTDALGQTIDLAGEHAADAVTAFDALLGARRNAVGTGFSSVGGDVSRQAVGVAQQVAQARRVGVDVSPASVAAWAAINSGSGSAAEEYKDRAAAVETFLAPHMALTATAPLTMPPDVAGALEAAPAAPAAPADPGFSLLSDEIKTLAGAVAISAVGEPSITAREMKTRLLERAPDVGGLMMKVFGGDVEGADGVKRLMTRDEADQYGYLMLAYIAENPQTNVVDANVAIRKALGVKTAAAAKEEADAKAKAEAAAKDQTGPVQEPEAEIAALRARAESPRTPEDRAVRADMSLRRMRVEAGVHDKDVTGPTRETVGLDVYMALSSGVRAAGTRGVRPGYESVARVYDAVEPSVRPLAKTLAETAADVLLSLTPKQLAVLASDDAVFRRPSDPKDEGASLDWFVLEVQKGLATKKLTPGEARVFETVGGKALAQAAIGHAKEMLGAIPANVLRVGRQGGDTRSVAAYLSAADKKALLRASGASTAGVTSVSSGLARAVLYAALAGGDADDVAMTRVVRRSWSSAGGLIYSGVVRDFNERDMPELQEALPDAGSRFAEYADAEFVRVPEAAQHEPEPGGPALRGTASPAVVPPTPSEPPKDPPFLQIADAAYLAARGERLDKVRALAAGDAVAERIKQRPLTEAARAALYNEDVPAPFVRAGLPPEEVDQSRRQTLERLYTGKIRSEQVPSEYRMLLGARLKTAQKVAAEVKAQAKIDEDERSFAQWERRENVKAARGDNVLGTVAPDGEPADTGPAQ